MTEQCSKVDINGITYERVDLPDQRLVILVADNRGLTFIGRCSLEQLHSDSKTIDVSGARCIIRWGTSGHLAELVDGPKDKTRLGVSADVVLFRGGATLYYLADEKKWGDDE